MTGDVWRDRAPRARGTIGRLAAALLAAVAVLVLALASAAPAPAAVPDLRVRGNALINAATGARFVPRGVNWPSFEYACYWGYGYSNERSDASVGPDEQDAANLARWHINTVRLPLNQDCWLGDEGLPHSDGVKLTSAGYRQAVQAWVSLLHKHGIAVVLDLHWGPGPQVNWASGMNEGQKAMADMRSDDFWASVGATFRRDRAVMFDAFNEPYSRWDDQGQPIFDLTWRCWRNGGCRAPVENDETGELSGRTYVTAGMQALVNALRGAGATQPIILSGRDYANDLGSWLANRPVDGRPGTADDQLVAGFHNYRTQRCSTAGCWDTEVARVAAKVPVLTTEFGESDCLADHVNRYMTWADRHNVGYLMWQWVLPDGDAVCGEDSAFSLLAHPDGTPRAPVGTALKDHLAHVG